MIVTLGLAGWKGGEPERWGGMIIIAMWALQTVGEYAHPSRFVTVDPFPFLSDLVGTIGFGVIAVHARRAWPLWAAALQLLSLSAHFARWADLKIPAVVYALMRGGPTFVVILVLFLGTILHIRRLKRYGRDAPWQRWTSPSDKSDR